MSIISNTLTSFDAKGNREDLLDQAWSVSPTETPFSSKIANSTATARYHEWQTYALSSAADNAQIEGDDSASLDSAVVTTRVGNRVQESAKKIAVTGIQDAVNTAGRKKEFTFQLVQAGKELKRDIETALTGNYAAVTGSNTVAPHLRGLSAWYTTNVNKASDGGNGSTSAARTDGTQRPFLESDFLDVCQQIYTSGGRPDMIMLGAYNKRKFAGFSGAGMKTENAADRTTTYDVEVYRTPWGQLTVVTNLFQRARDAHILQSDMWAKADLQKQFVKELPADGNYEKAGIYCAYTLEARNEASSGIVADLTTTD